MSASVGWRQYGTIRVALQSLERIECPKDLSKGFLHWNAPKPLMRPGWTDAGMASPAECWRHASRSAACPRCAAPPFARETAGSPISG